MAHKGMIKWWVHGQLVMEFTVGRKEKSGNDNTGFRIRFGGGINEMDHEEEEEICRTALAEFVQNFGGRGRSDDPEYLKCQEVIEKIWKAGEGLYGKPWIELIADEESTSNPWRHRKWVTRFRTSKVYVKLKQIQKKIK
jgi:hypothetical protein